ncbi:Cytochrome P450 monooxygenase atnE [Paramyrothecium foliicola]|nr:Cytochrome P450 monooxygenase atnE [Paramyrothecium foliicola]
MDSTLSFEYEPLPPITKFGRSSPFTRLLLLAPGRIDEPLAGRLLVVNVEAALEPYEALSYAWGSEPPTSALELGAQHLPIRPNLDAALRALRRPTHARVLWVDAVCIDQCNLDERSRQVGYMRSVYKYATAVIAWVGPKTPGVEMAFDAMMKLAAIRELRQEQRNKGQTVGAEEAAGSVTNAMTNELPAESQQLLLEFWQRPYFSRCWCVQEIVASQQALIKCGEIEVPFAIATGCLLTLAHLREHVDVDSPLLMWQTVVERTQLGADALIDGSLGPMLKTLHQMRSLQATDVRDKIFAVHGICDEGLNPIMAWVPVDWLENWALGFLSRTAASVADYIGNLGVRLCVLQPSALRADYRKSVVDVYTELTRYLVHSSHGSLEVLDQVMHLDDPENSEFPSWVPRWFEPRTSELFSTGDLFQAGLPCMSSAGKWWLPSSRTLGDPRVLTIDGFNCDRVDRISDTIFYSDFDKEPSLKIFEQTWQQLFSCPLTPPPQLFYHDGQPLDLAFCKALSFYPMGIAVGKFGVLMRVGDAGMSSQVVEQFMSTVGDMMKIPEQFLDRLNRFRSAGSSEPFPSDDSFHAFLNAARFYGYGRRVFVTHEGRLGLGPQMMRPEDKVVILNGGKLPYVIRPKKDDHVFIGSCYLVDEDVMDGRWAKQCLKTVIFCALLSSFAYNVYLHPLAHIPGPFLGRASGFPSYYHSIKGDRHIWLWQQFERYGNKIRAEPNLVLWRDPKAFADIYGTKSNVQRSTYYEAWKTSDEDKTVMTAVDKAEHAAKRKLLNLAFTEKSTRAASEFVVKHVDRWHEILSEQKCRDGEWSSTVNIAHELDFLIFDIMGNVSFGSSFDTKEPGDNPLREVPAHIANYLKFYYPIVRSPFVDVFCWFKPRGLDNLFQRITPPPVKAFYDFVHQSVISRLDLYKKQAILPESERQQDMVYFLCEAKNPDTGLPAYDEAKLRSESVLLIIAGSSSTALSLKGIIFYLTGDSERCDRLKTEIRSTFRTADEIVYGPKLLNLPYLRACVEEGLRLTPAAPCEMSREVLQGGLVVNGDFIPEGTVVGTVPFCDSRNDSIYGDSGVFRPERWILDEELGESEETLAAMRANFHPFLAGPGACAGKALAWTELLIVLARTLHRFDIRRAPGSKLATGGPSSANGPADERILHFIDTSVTTIDGPEIQFRKRRT